MKKLLYMFSRWTDERGGNIKPNSWSSSSENPTTFNVVYHFLWDKTFGLTAFQKNNLQRLIAEKYLTNGLEYRTNNGDSTSGFSLDESISVAAACYKYGFKDEISFLKIWTSQTWFRFYDVIPFLIFCKYAWTKWLWIPQLVAAVFLPWYSWIFCIPIQVFVAGSILSSSWKAPEETSGKQLNYIQAIALIDKWWVQKLWKWIQEFVDYREVFQFYYPEENHHINMMAQEIWL